MSLSLLSLAQAQEKMLNQITSITETESVSLFDALNRIVAKNIISPINVPSFDNSAMDGYAVRLEDLAHQPCLPVAATILAGPTQPSPWPKGSCVRIMTGAATPEGADAVIMQEHAEVTEHGIRLTEVPQLGQNIRRVGEDVAIGQTVITLGDKLSITKLSVLASLGITQIDVYRRLKVALFSTGDELQPIHHTLQAGQIYDTNRFTVRLMLEKLGCEVIDLGIIPDDPIKIRRAFKEADRLADVVISSGGVSVGEADYTKQILHEAGEISFWKLAIKPGKPFAFGRLAHSWFCGLPGNPVSATVTFYQLVQPLLIKLSGYSHWRPTQRFKVKTLSALKKTPGRLDFQRGILTSNEQGELAVTTTGHQGSHISQSLSQANCFIVLEQARGNVSIGELVTVEPFNQLLES